MDEINFFCLNERRFALRQPYTAFTAYEPYSVKMVVIVIWTCFSASGRRRLDIAFLSAFNSEVHKQILHKNVKISICDLKLKRKWITQ